MKPVGRVRFPFAGQAVVATLYRGPRGWVCPIPHKQDYLNLHFPMEDVSEADGTPGARQLNEAARALRGTAEIA